MRRTTLATLGLLALAAGGAAQDAPPAGRVPPPAEAEAAASRWTHNPRARTAVGLDHLSAGDAEAALDAFEHALALAPSDPLLQFNAGTASLAGGGEGAIERLAAAAETASDDAPVELRAAAHYNLGNARLGAGDPASAIESYEQSLRLEPGNLDAKHNLELAQRLLEEQQQQQQQQQPQDQQGDGEPQEQTEEQESPGENDDSQQQPEQQEPGDSGPREGEQPPDDSKRPLPDFEEQPEMTAEQAAAILEAVENLEREQRRKQALEQHKKAKGERDW